MKFKFNTLILLGIALGLGGAVYFWEAQGASLQTSQKAAAQSIFGFKEDQVQALRIKTPQQTLSLVRQNPSGTPAQKNQPWLIKAPIQAPASDASVAYLLNLLVTAKRDRSLSVPATRAREFGLDQPQATVEVKLNNQTTHQLVLGGPDYNHSVLYAQADPPAQPASDLKVLLVPTAFENAVNRPLSEWQQDNRSNKPTPIDPD